MPTPFYHTLPVHDNSIPPWEQLFSAYPYLADFKSLLPDQAAFFGWSCFLAQQLHPQGRVQTVEVFAERQRMPAEEFYSLLLSEDRMEREVFNLFPRGLLEEYRKDLIEASVSLLNNYL